MKSTKLIGKLVSVIFSDRPTPICGYIMSYNDEWTLMKYNPEDYIIDGYVIFRNKKVREISRSEDEKWKEKVINLKGLKPTKSEIIPITDLDTILSYLTNEFGVFQLYTNSETTCYLGRVRSLTKTKLIVDDLTPRGVWDGSLEFRPSEISVIEFDTDYINSLKLVARKGTKKNK